jgi:2-polyprenyl-6-methoxyphenol hydroxylase-like FAD-dependent oxidoreductase
VRKLLSNLSDTGPGLPVRGWSPSGLPTGAFLLAGDAVHLFTPNGGFGMNTGVDDVANLTVEARRHARRLGRKVVACFLRE